MSESQEPTPAELVEKLMAVFSKAQGKLSDAKSAGYKDGYREGFNEGVKRGRDIANQDLARFLEKQRMP